MELTPGLVLFLCVSPVTDVPLSGHCTTNRAERPGAINLAKIRYSLKDTDEEVREFCTTICIFCKVVEDPAMRLVDVFIRRCLERLKMLEDLRRWLKGSRGVHVHHIEGKAMEEEEEEEEETYDKA
ncbi:ryanodine receptor 1b [Lates japonicus]|uniref:Ryanodine receptor 1b n=1 Tax=Lates japonicus TaxID=270547 RepID=A0AAD3MFT5_LATJO|nr:ryanodine receptor 1b [Lates japonicus]